MQNKLFILFFVLISIFGFSQKKKDFLKQIDSISQKNWNKTNINLDSLNDPKLVEIKAIAKDTIGTVVFRERESPPPPLPDVPVTPFNFINNSNKEDHWFFYGQHALTLNQSSFSRWNSGGNNNIGVIGKVNYNLTYKYNKHYLENLIEAGYGFSATEGSATQKTNDYINLSLNYGYDLGNNYYFSAGYKFSTQFAPGYDYSDTPDPERSDRISSFMAPGYLNLGLGISYNPKENLQFIFRPFSSKFTFVLDSLLQKEDNYGLKHDGQSVRTELGVMFNVVYKLQIVKNMSFTNQLTLFSNYLFHTERVDIAYNGAFVMKFNKYINANISVDLAYDHDQIQKLQTKQTLGIGLTYDIGAEAAKKQSNSKIFKPYYTK